MRIGPIRTAAISGILLFGIGVLAQSTESQENVIRVDIDGLRSDPVRHIRCVGFSRRELQRQAGHEFPGDSPRGCRGIEQREGPYGAPEIFRGGVSPFREPHGAEGYGQLPLGALRIEGKTLHPSPSKRECREIG